MNFAKAGKTVLAALAAGMLATSAYAADITLKLGHLANEQNLTIIPVINKIDLPSSDLPKVHRQLEEIICIPAPSRP